MPVPRHLDCDARRGGREVHVRAAAVGVEVDGFLNLCYRPIELLQTGERIAQHDLRGDVLLVDRQNALDAGPRDPRTAGDQENLTAWSCARSLRGMRSAART
jgi:hypothetical protein